MMNSERAISRLKNIQAIEPLLAALRSFSLGSWQTALNKINNIEQYEEKFNPILAEILPQIRLRRSARIRKQKHNNRIADAILLIIGSERSLCGKFNKTISDNTKLWLQSQNFHSYQIWAMGSNMIQHLERSGINLSWKQSLNSKFATSYNNSYLLTMKWLEQYEAFNFNHFFLIFNQLSRNNSFKFSTKKLIPYFPIDVPPIYAAQKDVWPPPIIETDPRGIYNQIINQKITSSFFLALLKSSIAENSYRFNLLQNAKENAEDIIEELKHEINTKRKQSITQEMQELASGAGLLDN